MGHACIQHNYSQKEPTVRHRHTISTSIELLASSGLPCGRTSKATLSGTRSAHQNLSAQSVPRAISKWHLTLCYFSSTHNVIMNNNLFELFLIYETSLHMTTISLIISGLIVIIVFSKRRRSFKTEAWHCLAEGTWCPRSRRWLQRHWGGPGKSKLRWKRVTERVYT